MNFFKKNGFLIKIFHDLSQRFVKILIQGILQIIFLYFFAVVPPVHSQGIHLWMSFKDYFILYKIFTSVRYEILTSIPLEIKPEDFLQEFFEDFL